MKTAVFAIIYDKDINKILATTRPEDTNTPFALPGGKVDLGETETDALLRETAEEGIELIEPIFEKVHTDIINGFNIVWYKVTCEYNFLFDYKEKDRGIKAIHKTIEEIANSGYGNSFIANLKF